jgi:L-histidine N-alpha-methyltransferase
VTAEFNRNVLYVLNRELGADFDPGAFAHRAFWDEVNSWIDVRLRSQADQTVTIPAIDMRVAFAEREEMRTEISAKFTRRQLEAIYGEVGLEFVAWWTDPEDLFALSLARAV